VSDRRRGPASFCTILHAAAEPQLKGAVRGTVPSLCSAGWLINGETLHPWKQPVSTQRAAWLAFTEPHRACDFGPDVGGVLTRHSTLTGTMLLGESTVWTCPCEVKARSCARGRGDGVHIQLHRFSLALLYDVPTITTTTTSLNVCAILPAFLNQRMSPTLRRYTVRLAPRCNSDNYHTMLQIFPKEVIVVC
jgi:hypothetical protein